MCTAELSQVIHRKWSKTWHSTTASRKLQYEPEKTFSPAFFPSSYFTGTSVSQLSNQTLLQRLYTLTWTSHHYTWFHVDFQRFIRFLALTTGKYYTSACAVSCFICISTFWLFHLVGCMHSGEQKKKKAVTTRGGGLGVLSSDYGTAINSSTERLSFWLSQQVKEFPCPGHWALVEWHVYLKSLRYLFTVGNIIKQVRSLGVVIFDLKTIYPSGCFSSLWCHIGNDLFTSCHWFLRWRWFFTLQPQLFFCKGSVCVI